MKTNTHPQEKGQVLVLVAILMIVMLAMLALVLDGGNLLLNRRGAQNAADSGALAGARTLCLGGTNASAEAAAQDYAVNRNGATTANVVIGTNRSITVTSTITYNTFFAHILGFDALTAEAVAAAGCFPPTSGERVMPIAWICKPPLAGSTSPNCQAEAIDQETLNDYLINPLEPDGSIHPELYVIMDSNSVPSDLADMCGIDIVCDLDGDGNDDLIANGDRSWLDLNGAGGGSSSLVDWINGGFTQEIDIYTWIGGQAGVANNVFQAVGDHIGDIFAIPVFDRICDGYPSTDCPTQFDAATDTIIYTAGGNYYYRIRGFAAFVPTCVNAPGVPGPSCPGHDFAVSLDAIDNNTKTIEGYFVTGILGNLSGGSPTSGAIDLSVYNLRLSR